MATLRERLRAYAEWDLNDPYGSGEKWSGELSDVLDKLVALKPRMQAVNTNPMDGLRVTPRHIRSGQALAWVEALLK